MKTILTFAFMITVFAGCRTIKNTFVKLTPYEQYIQSLKNASLDEAPMTLNWIQAGETALNDSLQTDLPFGESGFFAAGKPRATGYRFELKDGQNFTASISVNTVPGGKIFLDLFRIDGEEIKHVASADSTGSLQYEFGRDVSCILRLQPELLIDVFYSLQLTATPVLINPVMGADNRSIRSYYGDPREGGRRSHEGVDIFAPKGTPVVAPTTGFISRTGTNRLGGKVVWMRDHERGHAYYFAHLDSQLVKPGMRVKTGDTLGLVGNTGNARTTPPHLHFGIYQSGAKDPLNFIRSLLELARPMPIDTVLRNAAFRVEAREANLRSGPGTTFPVKDTLREFAYLSILAQAGDWFRVRLADQTEGFIFSNLVVAADAGKPFDLEHHSVLLTEPAADAVPLAEYDQVSGFVLAESENFSYVRTGDGRKGWLVVPTEEETTN